MISYNTFDLENNKFDLRVYQENGKVVLLVEQDGGMLYLSFPNENKYQQFVQALV